MSQTLDHKHKASLQKFIDKNDWIQSQVELLEGTALPGVDFQGASLDGSTLAHLTEEHNKIDAQVQELDNGELRALRLLAKAASKKNLSPEDTDFIEITLKVLSSLDKLLHLLRQRSKALQLLKLNAKYHTATQKAEKDLRLLLEESLIGYVDKARWTVPKEAVDEVGRRPRLSNGITSASTSMQSTTSKVTTSSSVMARQMRAEIITLDLASITSRMRTLSHSTLPSTSKLLDAMIDAATVPLPEQFLDYQDDLEARTKDSLLGISDFCQSLLRQWREADDIYWTCAEQHQAAEVLEHDTNAAMLKLPSEELATSFESRFIAISDHHTRVSRKHSKEVTMPLHAKHIPDQKAHNSALVSTLARSIEKFQKALESSRDAVMGYRDATKAFTTGQDFRQEVKEVMAALRTALKNITPRDLRSALDPAGMEIALQVIDDLVHKAEHTVLPRASAIIRPLQLHGIDPNVRKALQDSLAALSECAREARLFLAAERSKLAAARQLAELDTQHSKVSILVESKRSQLNNYISRALWQPGLVDSELDDLDLVDLAEVLDARDTLRRITDAMIKTLADLQPMKLVPQNFDSSYLLKKFSDIEGDVIQLEHLRDCLRLIRKQKSEAESITLEFEQLETALDATAASARQCQPLEVDIDGISQDYLALSKGITELRSRLSRQLSFVHGHPASSHFDLEAHDARLREHFNTRSTELQARAAYVRDSIATVQTMTQNMSRLQAHLESVEQIVVIADGLAEQQISTNERTYEEMCSLGHKAEALNVLVQEIDISNPQFESDKDFSCVEEVKKLRSQISSQIGTTIAKLATKRNAMLEDKLRRLQDEKRVAAQSDSSMKEVVAEQDVAASPACSFSDPENDEQQPACDVSQQDSHVQHCTSDETQAHKKSTEISPTEKSENVISAFDGHYIETSAALLGTRTPDYPTTEAAENARKCEEETSNSRPTSPFVDIQDAPSVVEASPWHVGLPDAVPAPHTQENGGYASESLNGSAPMITGSEVAVLRSVIRRAEQRGEEPGGRVVDKDSLDCVELVINTAMDLVDIHSDKINDISGLTQELERVDHLLRTTQELTATANGVQEADVARLAWLRRNWNDIRNHILQEGSSDAQEPSPMTSRTLSRSSSFASDLNQGAGATFTEEGMFRFSSLGSSSRIPVAPPRQRTSSTTSMPHTSYAQTATRLPRPMSTMSATETLLSPMSSSRSTPKARAQARLGILSPVSPSSSAMQDRRVSAHAGSLANNGAGNMSLRRSSPMKSPRPPRRPNAYKANRKRKLDVAVGHVVNDFKVPISISAADSTQSEAGKYWIGDPPKLYYARILRSHTVMLRVGGGWQELSSFLDTHYNQVFHIASLSQPRILSDRMARLSVSNLESPLARHISLEGNKHLTVSTSRSGNDVEALPKTLPSDLTTLLTKSTSVSPKTRRTSSQQWDAQPPIPWRI